LAKVYLLAFGLILCIKTPTLDAWSREVWRGSFSYELLPIFVLKSYVSWSQWRLRLNGVFGVNYGGYFLVVNVKEKKVYYKNISFKIDIHGLQQINIVATIICVVIF
jgi:hypothetical protein